MQIPVGFAQITHLLGGSGIPNGAAVVYGVENEIPDFAENVAQKAHEAFATGILPQLTDGVTLERTVAKLGPTDTGPSAEYSLPINGSLAVPMVPPNVAILVGKGTALGGREGKGRMYLPGGPEEEMTAAGLLDPAYRTALQGAVGQFAVELSTAGIPIVLLHNSATAPTPITQLQVQALVATQRRRLRR